MSVRLPVWRLNEHLTELLRMQHLHVIGTSVPVQFLVVVTPHLEITILVKNLLKKIKLVVMEWNLRLEVFFVMKY